MSGDLSYVIVGNIPSTFHSVDLRSFFSQFIESEKFDCFHFRHRPEILKRQDETGTHGGSLSLKGKTTCCVVRLREEHIAKLLQVYNGEKWIDKDEKLYRLKATIARITIKHEGSTQPDSFQTKKEKRDHKRESVEFLREDLLRLSELHPPSFLPNGNVGTSLNVFKDLIRTCQLPPQVIKKLGLSFPSGRSKRRYGNVAFDYGKESEGNVLLCAGISCDNKDEKCGNKDEKCGKNQILKENIESVADGQTKSVDSNICISRVDMIAELPEKEDSDSKCFEVAEDTESEPEEDWERHEALHDDVDCQARTKERLFENKIELKWEKGGSGLVFYTDAAYWDSLNGDFDEQTADDWDVDMSVYERGGTGDRHSKALLEMRIEDQRRAGVDVEEDLGVRKVGEFEKHTKGFGGNLMKKQGWSEGTGLGTSQPGITEPIPNEGQPPHCKKGLGYFGEKLERHVKRQRVEREIVISTVFDTSKEKASTPLQSVGPFTLKYRDKVNFIPEKGNDTY